MYQYIDGACALSVNDWMAAGLTYSQFKHDSERGYKADLALQLTITSKIQCVVNRLATNT